MLEAALDQLDTHDSGQRVVLVTRRRVEEDPLAVAGPGRRTAPDEPGIHLLGDQRGITPARVDQEHTDPAGPFRRPGGIPAELFHQRIDHPDDRGIDPPGLIVPRFAGRGPGGLLGLGLLGGKATTKLQTKAARRLRIIGMGLLDTKQ